MSIRKPQALNDERNDQLSGRVFSRGLVLNLTTDDFEEMSAVAPKWDQEYVKVRKGAIRRSLLGFHTSRIHRGAVAWVQGIRASAKRPDPDSYSGLIAQEMRRSFMPAAANFPYQIRL